MVGLARPWLHEELVHVPLLVRLPGSAESGERVSALTVTSELGPAIILGHLDSYTGPAVFWRLSSLHPGDAARIRREDGSELDFRIQRLSTFSTGAFPTNEVYGPTAGPELRLISCGGGYSLTRRQYLANVVAFASMGSLRSASQLTST